MESPPLQKLREELSRLETELDLMLSLSPKSHVVSDLRTRADAIRQAIEKMRGH